MLENKKVIERLVGRIDDMYYVCDCVFGKDDFYGAMGAVLCPVSKEQYEHDMDAESGETQDRFQESWAEQAKQGDTDKGLKDYVEEILAVEGEEALYDFGGYDYWDMIREQVPELTKERYPIFDCVAGGRCFDANMEWDEIYDPVVWELILKCEREN